MRYERLSDLLRLAFSLAGTREGLSLDEIASEQGVSRRTAERMLAALRESFPQLESVPGDGRSLRWRLPQNAMRGVLAADTRELLELDAAARRLREEGAADGRADALVSLAAKVRTALAPALLRRTEVDTAALMEAEGTAVRPGPRHHVPESVLRTIREGLLASHRLSLMYASEGTNPPGKERIVEPLGLLHGQRPYLVAQIAGHPANPSVFRLDRVTSVTMLPDAFQGDPTFNLQDYAARSFGVWQEEPIDVTLRFSGSAAQEAKDYHFHPTQRLVQEPDGSLVVRFTAGGRLEMVQHFATWGDKLQIVGPDALREAMVEWATAIALTHSRNAERSR